MPPPFGIIFPNEYSRRSIFRSFVAEVMGGGAFVSRSIDKFSIFTDGGIDFIGVDKGWGEAAGPYRQTIAALHHRPLQSD